MGMAASQMITARINTINKRTRSPSDGSGCLEPQGLKCRNRSKEHGSHTAQKQSQKGQRQPAKSWLSKSGLLFEIGSFKCPVLGDVDQHLTPAPHLIELLRFIDICQERFLLQ